MSAPDMVLHVALALLAALAVLPLRARRPPSRREHLAFAITLAVAMTAGHWESLQDNRPWVNPDEAQMLAGALTLRDDPVFWRSVDGTTHGPLDQWPLTLASWAGLPLDFQTARILSVACQTGMLLLLQYFMATHGLATGRLGLLPVTLWLAGNKEPELHQLCSEHVPLLLLAAACVTGFPARPEALPRWRAALFGALLVAIPLAKLQGAPLAAALGGCWAWWLIRAKIGLAGPGIPAAIGGALAGLFILGPTWLAGAGAEFWTSYVVANKNYALGHSWAPLWPHYVWGLNRLLGMTCLLCVVAAVADQRSLWRHPGLALGTLLGIASLFAILLPGYPILHYWLLLLPALAILSGTALQVALAAFSPRRQFTLVAALVLAMGLLLVVKRQWQTYPRWEESARLPIPASPALLATIQRLSPSGDSLAVWGWAPELYVLSRRRQAVREAQTSAQIHPGALQDHFRRRFLGDLRRNRPAVFVDAVHPGAFTFQDRSRQAHEIFGELRDWIGKNYEFDGDYDGLRVYRRR